MDLTGPFRGSVAVASGALTRGVLAGPRFRRLYPDVYVPAALPVDLTVRSFAAALAAGPGAVLAGYSAAEVLEASCGPPGCPAEVTVPRGRHPRPGLVVHRELLAPDEVQVVAGVRVTSPARTAFDLARRCDLVEGVVAVDALAHRHPITAAALRALRSRHLGARGSRGLEAVLALMDRWAESPMESRMRVALRHGGLRPSVQHPVVAGARECRLDLAFPEAMLGVEYDGAEHRDPDKALADLEREALLACAGWKVIRFRAAVVLFRPEVLVARTLAELRVRTTR